MTEPEIGTGKTIFVIAVVLGCFAVLYPKIFYHMMFDEKKDKDPLKPTPGEFGGRPPMHRGHPSLHMRNTQGPVFHGEEGQQVRRFTIEKDLKPGPVPGMRPTMGGPGMPQIPRANQGGGGGTMSILMPLYTTGIVIFFVYTVMKIMFKKNDESSENSEDMRPNRRLHQQLRSQAITPEFMQHQQRVNAAVAQSRAEELVPNSSKNQSINKESESESIPVKVKEPVTKTPTKSESKSTPPPPSSDDPRDEQIRILKERLEETEKAMQMIVTQMTAMTTQMPNPISDSKKMKKIEVQESEDENNEEDLDSKDSDDETDEEELEEKVETLKATVGPLAQES